MNHRVADALSAVRSHRDYQRAQCHFNPRDGMLVVMESLTLSQLKMVHSSAYAALPAKLAMATFISDGLRVSARLDNKVWVWDHRKWKQLDPWAPLKVSKHGFRPGELADTSLKHNVVTGIYAETLAEIKVVLTSDDVEEVDCLVSPPDPRGTGKP